MHLDVVCIQTACSFRGLSMKAETGLFVVDSLWALRRANLLPGVPSKEFLKGNSKSKKTSYIEVLLTRWRIVTHLLSLSGEQFLKDRFCLASTSLQSWPIDGVELTAPSLVLAEIVKDFHQGQFDPCLHTFLAECPGGRIRKQRSVFYFFVMIKGYVFREYCAKGRVEFGRNWKQLLQE